MDTITIGRIPDGLRALLIDPPLVCQPLEPTALMPFWRAWVDLLDVTVTTPSREELPAAIDSAVAEAWHRYADRGELVTASDRRTFVLLQARVRAIWLHGDR